MFDFKGYKIKNVLGRGGFGVVYLVEKSGKKYALKLVDSEQIDPRDLQASLEECETLQLFNHPNIIKCYESGVEEGKIYSILEYVDGIDLQEYLDTHGRLASSVTEEIAEQMLSALRHIHSLGYLYRDVKSSNIIYSPENNMIKLVDFGLAMNLNINNDEGDIVGTPLYMDPEYAKDAISKPKTDIYSLGVVLYELIAGYNPFDAESINPYHTIRNHISITPPGIGDISPKLNDLVFWMIQKESENRPTAKQALEYLYKKA